MSPTPSMSSSAVLSTRTQPGRPVGGVVSIGVAITVPAPWAQQLRAARHETGDPQAGIIPPHVTLLPPTQVPVRAMPRIRHHLTVACGHIPPFRLTLQGTGTFRPVSAVVFAQVVEGAAECERLQRVVNRGVLQRSLQFDYHPHVTLGHDVSDERLDAVSEKMAEFSASFQVEHVGLYWFAEAGVWEVDTTIDLGSDPANKEHRPRT